MNTGTKWFLGILIGIFLIVALAAAGFLVFNRWNGAGMMMGERGFRFWDGGHDLPWQGMPMQPFGGPQFSRGGGFPLVAAMVGGSICFGVLALIAVGVFLLIRSLSKPAQPVVAPVQEDSVKACPNCGRSVQEDWSHCPYCGAGLANETNQE
jgi:hypothetical protein